MLADLFLASTSPAPLLWVLLTWSRTRPLSKHGLPVSLLLLLLLLLSFLLVPDDDDGDEDEDDDDAT